MLLVNLAVADLGGMIRNCFMLTGVIFGDRQSITISKNLILSFENSGLIKTEKSIDNDIFFTIKNKHVFHFNKTGTLFDSGEEFPKIN